MLRRRLCARLRKNHIKKAMRLIKATPPITPPATATVKSLPLRFAFPPLFGTATTVVVEPGPEVAWVVGAGPKPDANPIVVKGAAEVESVCKTSLCGGVGVADSCDTSGVGVVAAGTGMLTGVVVVDKTGTLESASLVCGCGATTAGTGASGVDDDIEVNCATEVSSDGVGAAAAGATVAAGVGVCSGGVCTAGGGTSTCTADVDEDKEKVLVVLDCVFTSFLGTAVHLLPPRVVIKAPRGKFGLIPFDMV